MSALEWTGERVVPWDLRVGPAVFHHHLSRYAWAVPHVYGRRVVDLGCGAGYGAFALSWVAASVLGVDVSADAVGFARLHFRAGNLRYEIANLCDGIPPGDVFTAFEVLEHLPDPANVVARVPGTLLWSIPVNDGSRYHVRPYSVAEIEAMMGGAIYYQGRDGVIVPREAAWFDPAYVLGVRP